MEVQASQSEAPVSATEATQIQESPAQAQETATEGSKEDSVLAKRLALIARREKEAFQKAQEASKIKSTYQSEYESKLKALEAEKAEIQKYKDLVERLTKQKDYKALDELGIDYNDWTQYKLNDNQPTIQALLEKQKEELTRSFEERLQAKEREQQERYKASLEEQQNQIKSRFKDELKTYLEGDFKAEMPKYEFLSLQEDPHELVYETIVQHHEATGKVLGKDEAAEIVEKYLEQEAMKLAKLRKTKTLFGEKVEDVKKPTVQSSAQSGPKTLTNSQMSPPTSGLNKVNSIQESLENAKKLLKWT